MRYLGGTLNGSQIHDTLVTYGQIAASMVYNAGLHDLGLWLYNAV